MPRKSKVSCQHPGCPELVEVGAKYCEGHKSLHPVHSASSRGYGSRWQKFRKHFLSAHPLCEECMKQGALYEGNRHRSSRELVKITGDKETEL